MPGQLRKKQDLGSSYAFYLPHFVTFFEDRTVEDKIAPSARSRLRLQLVFPDVLVQLLNILDLLILAALPVDYLPGGSASSS